MTGSGSARGCPRCGGQVSASAAFCGACGLLLAPPTPVRRRSAGPRTVFLALVGAVAIVGAGVGAGLLLQPKDRASGGTVAGASVGPATPGSTASGAPVALATPPIVDGAEDPTILVPPIPDEMETPPVDETRPPPVKLTVGAPRDLASQTIGASGGTLEAAGFKLEFPEGALAGDRPVTVTQAPITAAETGGLVTPITPLYTVDGGNGALGAPVTVTLPATVPAGATAMAFSWDEAAGTLTPLVALTQDATSITAGATHFSGILGGIIEVPKVPEIVDSGFRPGTDDWRFTNYGSYVASGGHCEGQSLTALWYYLAQHRQGGASALNGLYDNNGAAAKTPDLDWDDSDGYRLASNVQVDPLANEFTYEFLKDLMWGRADGTLTYEAFRTAIALTGEPQLIRIASDNGGNHTMVVYRVTPNWLMIADPNFPGHTRGIRYDAATGKLGPYSSGANAAEIAANGATSYTRFAYVPWRSAISEAAVAAHWTEFQNNAAGDSVFPGYTLRVLTGKDAAGKDVWAKLADGHRTTEKKLTITLTKLTDGSSSTMRIYPGTSSTPFGPDAFKQTIDLEDGENPLGIFVLGKVGNSWQYVDFVRLTVNSGESTDWELVDVQVKHTGVSVNQDYDWKYEGDGRGGITGIWTTRTSTGTATARMVGTWDIPDRLTPGTQVNVSGTVTSELDFKSGAADWCSGGMYQLGPEDGGLDAFAMNEAAAQPDIGRAAVPADQVQKLFFTMIGCDTGSGTMSAEKTATGTLTVPDRLAVTGDQVPYLVVGFVLDQDYDTVQVSYIYK
jgi:hypothetical protein